MKILIIMLLLSVNTYSNDTFLAAIDSTCGDTWCEGYDYKFQSVTCGTQSCTMLYEIADGKPFVKHICTFDNISNKYQNTKQDWLSDKMMETINLCFEDTE